MINISSIPTDELNNIDWSSLSKEELQSIIKQLESEAVIFDTMQMAAKISLNSIYGALGNEFFYFFDVRLAETITLQGQDAIKYSENVLNQYFFKVFHKDKELLNILKSKCPDVITEGLTACIQPVTIYIDTDSVQKDTIIHSDYGDITIEDLYNESIIDAGNTVTGHESVSTKRNVLNWTESCGLYYSKVRRVIRHKVSKSKWKLMTKSGKEIIVTNDHSLIVFRDNKQIEVKPSEVLKTDKILIVL